MAHLLASNPNTSHKLIICSNLGYDIRTIPRKACHRVRRKNGRAWSGLVLQCCSSSSSTSSSQLSFADQKVRLEIENGSGKVKQQVEYLVCEYGWRVRKLIENADEMRMAAQVQAEAFHVPVAFFNDLFFQFFKAEVLSGLLYKLKNSPPNRYACLVAEPAENDQDSPQQLVGVVDITAMRDQDVIQHLPAVAEEYLYISGIAVSNAFRRRKIASALLKACDMLSILWGFEFLALRAYEEDLGARKLYTNAGYQVVSRDPPWVHTKKRNRLKQKTMNDLVNVMANSRLGKKKSARRPRELSIDEFNSNDEWYASGESVAMGDPIEDYSIRIKEHGSSSTSVVPIDELDVPNVDQGDDEGGNNGGDDEDDEGDDNDDGDDDDYG